MTSADSSQDDALDETTEQEGGPEAGRWLNVYTTGGTMLGGITTIPDAIAKRLRLRGKRPVKLYDHNKGRVIYVHPDCVAAWTFEDGES